MENSFNLERLLLVGDSHGNIYFINGVCDYAGRNGIRRVLQLGDFGIWHGDGGQAYVDAVSKAALRNNLRFDFIDGNHEDFDLLDAIRASGVYEADGSIKIADGLHWWVRGSVVKWCNKYVGFLGGAVSVDRYYRVKHRSWWPQEVLTDSDADLLIANVTEKVPGGKLDLLVTHDSPSESNVPGGGTWPAELIAEAEVLRARISKVVAATKPKLLVHGHWHVRYRTSVNVRGHRLRIYGLANEDAASIGILDLPKLEILGKWPTLREVQSARYGGLSVQQTNAVLL